MPDLSHLSIRMLRLMAEEARDRAQVALSRAERYKLALQRRAAAADALDAGGDEGEPVPVHHSAQHLAHVNHPTGRRLIIAPCGYDAHLSHAPSLVAGVS